MKARFLGDPAERSGALPLTRPAGDWFDIPEGEEAKYMGNAHYEVEGIDPPKPKRVRKAEPKPKPKIEHDDGWGDDET